MLRRWYWADIMQEKTALPIVRGQAVSRPPTLAPIRLLFIAPPNITYEDFVSPPRNVGTITKNNGERQFGSLITDVPLGIISLSAYVKAHLPVVSLAIDFNVELNRVSEFSEPDFRTYFDAHFCAPGYATFAPEVVLISAQFTPAYTSVIDIAELSRKYFPDALVLVGGNLPTAMYRDVLHDSPAVDAVCYGEGEKALVQLLASESRSHALASNPTWVTRAKLCEPKFVPQRDFVWDLDEIPFLDYDMLDLEGYKLNPTSSRYSVSDNYMTKIDDDTVRQEETAGRAVAERSAYSMPIMTSRGCPYHCTFCASHNAHGRKMRYHSVDRVAADIGRMQRQYGISGVVIQDDHFMGGKERPYEIVSAIKDLGLDMFFQNALTIFALEPRFLRLLKEAGVHELVLPIESGSERVLRDIMKKPLRLNMVPPVVQNCREAGIFTDCNIILGMPGETKDDIEESRRFLKTIYADWFRVFVATPIPGSAMYDTCEANEYFKVTPLKANYKRAVIETEHMTPEYVQYMTYLMNIELNFVHNANLRLGNYRLALESFENVIRVKPDHAIAHYYAGYCHQELGRPGRAKEHYRIAESLCEQSAFWDDFVVQFSIPLRRRSHVGVTPALARA
jgi:radical SAM superfamily enzyme YgiQ (UPF0313 family)